MLNPKSWLENKNFLALRGGESLLTHWSLTGWNYYGVKSTRFYCVMKSILDKEVVYYDVGEAVHIILFWHYPLILLIFEMNWNSKKTEVKVAYPEKKMFNRREVEPVTFFHYISITQTIFFTVYTVANFFENLTTGIR